MNRKGHAWQIDKLVFILIGIALAALWSVVAAFSVLERDFTLDRASEQLAMTVATLADFNELSQQSATPIESNARTEALWRALLRYPAASIWVETQGVVIDGLPALDLSNSIVAQEIRSNFTVFAALPQAEALADWYRTLWRRAILLGLTSLGFVVLAYFLVRALKQRTLVERDAAVLEERNAQLTRHQLTLEQTVSKRTADLKVVNTRLETELVERRATEQTLREHDGLLSSVAKGAAELLGSRSLDQAIEVLLQLVGQTLAVRRVTLNTVVSGIDGNLLSTIEHEWHVTGLKNLGDDAGFKSVDISAQLPGAGQILPTGGIVTFSVNDIPAAFREHYEKADLRSFLLVPVHVESRLWGHVTFIDNAEQGREWNWAETDTLRTLAGLVGAAIARQRNLQELSDANMIVQNTPTVLYRLRGEPGLPLAYVSQNISKFGHRADDLLRSESGLFGLVAEEHRDAVSEVMDRIARPDGQSATIEYKLRTGKGDYRWVENRCTPIRDEQNRLKEVEGIIIDITERKQAEEKIAAMARTDSLTGLANRATFNERLHDAFASAKRHGSLFAVMYLDLDHFKDINDTLGHPVGDELLKAVAKRLQQCIRESDLVARLGGDEYAVLQLDIAEPASAGILAHNIQQFMSRPFQLSGNDLRVTTSIGICLFSEDSDSPEQMLVQADLALYRAKEEGRNTYRFHSDDLDRLVMERSELTDDLRKALEAKELVLRFQHQMTLEGERIVGTRAVVGWNHPERGYLLAQEFVPVAEKSGLIIGLAHWVLDEACHCLSIWRSEGMQLKRMTLPLTGAQLKDSRTLLRDIAETTERWGLKPDDIEFDVTEAILAQATFTGNEVLTTLRDLGCHIAIDKFGTEYSSIDYLRNYSMTQLKIDRSFVDEALADVKARRLLGTMIRLGNDLGIGVVVDGIESDARRRLLASAAQVASEKGCYYGAAVSAAEAGALLRGESMSAFAESEGRAETSR
ncbi:MAG: diguanylate cyclase [Gammaproteobacteria bacterium]|nr:diguanylate cyclase [Gammaproteobacteria bacterium]